MQRVLPGLRMHPVHDEYVRGLSRVRATHPACRLLVLWLGSSIGNFDKTEAVDILRALSGACHRDDVLLVGFDLLKEPAALVAAYADGQGVTAEFNYNLLRRINRELGGDFDVDAFVHHATFRPDQGRMESYLISKKHQTVTVGGLTFEFGAWEAIRWIALFRLALPGVILRYAGGREVTLRDLQAMGMTAGINALIVGNYLTTLGRSTDEDMQMLVDLKMPVGALTGAL